jgi:hypothetical protein
LVVEEVVRHVVASVAKDATTVRSCGRIPVPEDDSVRKFPEGCGEHDKQRGRHDKPVLIHREVMVDAVEEKMQGDTNAVVW